MPAQLTSYLEDGRRKYRVPEVWHRLSWARNFDNYPDPEHQVLSNEYDWKFKDEKGVVYGYINHIEGNERLLKVGKTVKRKIPAKPFTYYAFAQGAVYIHNNPEVIRDIRFEKGIPGAFVVNFVNSIPVDDLFPSRFNDAVDAALVDKLKSKTHIIPVTYSALYSRVFNETSGIEDSDKLLIEPREAKIMLCPNPECQCAFELLSKDFWLPGDPEYVEKTIEAHSQHEYRKYRDIHGDRPE